MSRVASPVGRAVHVVVVLVALSCFATSAAAQRYASPVPPPPALTPAQLAQTQALIQAQQAAQEAANLAAAKASAPVPQAPGAPQIQSVAAGDGGATVAFTATSMGSASISGYVVTASPGGATATGPTSPITLKGLTNGTPYTITVAARNVIGLGPASTPSPSVTPVATIVKVASVPPVVLRGTGTTLVVTATFARVTDLKLTLTDATHHVLASWSERSKPGVTKLEIRLPAKVRLAGRDSLLIAPSGGDSAQARSVPIVLESSAHPATG